MRKRRTKSTEPKDKIVIEPLRDANRKEFENALYNVIVNARNMGYMDDLTRPATITTTANALLDIAYKGMPSWYKHHGHVPFNEFNENNGIGLYNDDLLFWKDKFVSLSALERHLPLTDNHPE